jgi:hypothetical protein
MDPNADVTQSKILVNLFLEDCCGRREKLIIIFFKIILKISFKRLFSGGDTIRVCLVQLFGVL